MWKDAYIGRYLQRVREIEVVRPRGNFRETER